MATLRDRARQLRFGWQLWGYTVIMLVPFAVTMVALAGLLIGVVPLFTATVPGSRQLVDGYRAAAGTWAGVPIRSPYRPARRTDLMHRVGELLREPATWRDLLWMLTAPVVGAVLAGLPVALPVGVVLAGLSTGWWWAGISVALAIAVAVFAAAGILLRAQARFGRLLLGPTRTARIDRLIESRKQVVDTSEAELRRIERDLHDGAQVRMVAVGMALRTIEQVLDTDPAAVRELVVEARHTAAAALDDLRRLVRGIHPPVLAERGLVDAIRATAMDTPMTVTVHSDLTDEPDPPIAAAVYFGVCELLANAAKHAEATEVAVTLAGDGERLRAIVRDNGMGGADPGSGSGLRGVQRRLAGFDGTLSIGSPEGGPTVVTMEIPCASSSPRTSTC